MARAIQKGKIPKQLEDATARFVEKNDKGLGIKWATSKAFSVRLPPDLEIWVEGLDNRSEWIRQAIAEKYEREQNQQSSGATAS